MLQQMGCGFVPLPSWLSGLRFVWSGKKARQGSHRPTLSCFLQFPSLHSVGAVFVLLPLNLSLPWARVATAQSPLIVWRACVVASSRSQRPDRPFLSAVSAPPASAFVTLRQFLGPQKDKVQLLGCW